MPTPHEKLARRADQNLIESIRAHARWQLPCEMHEQDGILMIAGATDFPMAYKNCLVRTDAASPASEVLNSARRFFAARRRGFTVFVRGRYDADLEMLCREAGMVQRSDAPCMLIDHAIDAPLRRTGVRIERITEERHVAAASAINERAYQALGLPPGETRALFAHPARVLGAGAGGMLAFIGDLPVATALTIPSAGASGLYWIGTLPEAGRNGLASACTALAVNMCLADGASVVTLQASPAGEPVYRRLGFREYDRLKLFRHARQESA